MKTCTECGQRPALNGRHARCAKCEYQSQRAKAIERYNQPDAACPICKKTKEQGARLYKTRLGACYDCRMAAQRTKIHNGGLTEFRRWQIKKHYGLTPQQLQDMIAAQLGRCAICAQEAPLNVDHDHSTGKIRALLCHHCNAALGNAKESETILLKMVDYLRQHK